MVVLLPLTVKRLGNIPILPEFSTLFATNLSYFTLLSSFIKSNIGIAVISFVTG